MPRLRLARRTNSLNHLRVMLVIKTQTEEHQNPPPILKIEAAAADYQELARLMEEKQQAEDTLAQMMEQWEALSCELEDAT